MLPENQVLNLPEDINKMKWWERVLLLFRPTRYAYDDAFRVSFKVLLGKIYILGP